MKPKTTCILCEKRKTEHSKPFCPHCYKHADVFDKIKVFRDKKIYMMNTGGFINRTRRKRFYSKYVRNKLGNDEE